jgi:hypothetical protein
VHGSMKKRKRVQINDKEEEEVMVRGCRQAEKQREQIKDKEEEKAMRRGCSPADKKRVQIRDKEEEKAMRRGVAQQTRKECRLWIRRKRRQGGGVQASRQEKSAD